MVLVHVHLNILEKNWFFFERFVKRFEIVPFDNLSRLRFNFGEEIVIVILFSIIILFIIIIIFCEGLCLELFHRGGGVPNFKFRLVGNERLIQIHFFIFIFSLLAVDHVDVAVAFIYKLFDDWAFA